jgi:hypothetical protein
MHAAAVALLALLAHPLLSVAATAAGDPAPKAGCWQEIRSVDDRADVDVREINRLIILLEDEIRSRSIASAGQESELRAKLEAAKLRRSGILDKQHDDLNAIRAWCDRSRDERQRAADADALPRVER